MELDIKTLALSIKALAEEKNLSEEVVKDVVEQALAAAYRRDYGDREQEVRVDLNLSNGDVEAYVTKDVVAGEPENQGIEISLKDAQLIRKNAQVGEQVEVQESVKEFGRVAAQTAKQVILQRLREAERDVVMAEFEDKIGSVINAIVARVEGSIVRLEIGKAQGIMPRSEQIQGEHYHSGQRLKVYLKDVERGLRGPQLIVSRGSAEFMRWLFSNEVPELESGAVEIKKIAREAGVRTKLAVASSAPGVDPVGTFVGGHGTRVNAVISEIGEQEKIDIVVYDDNSEQFIANALSPTKVSSITVEGNRAKVIVPSDQLSVAIGRGGQNVRLASKLTGFEIDVSAENTPRAPQPAPVEPEAAPQAKPAEPAARPRLKKKTELENSLLEAIDEQDK